MLTTLFTPMATITIIPQQKAITTTATFPIGTGTNDVQGRVLPSLTLSQSQAFAATGKGHQDTRYATGQLTFYNGQLQSVAVSSGTVFTGRDGVQIAITQGAVIPAADPSTNPPTFGQVTVSAQALRAGASGNIQAFDLSGSCCAASVIVKNLAPFANGRDARDFTYVTRGDIQHANERLTPLLLQSEQGALSAQLQPGEILSTPTCTPSVFSDHHPGDEAASVQVTVSETCKAVAYDQNSLQTAALRFVRGRLSNLNTHYQLIGVIQVTVRSLAMQNGLVSLTATLHGVWVYQLDEERIKTLVTGKPRLDALHLISVLSGVQAVSITGIHGNEQLPTDAAHIHILVFFTVS
jgi:VCBS repeat-containing protein